MKLIRAGNCQSWVCSTGETGGVLVPLENACPQHGTQKNLLGMAGSVPALLPPPPRQLLCLSLLGALPSPPSIGGFRAPSAPQTPTRFLRAWEARAAPAQLPGREELPADVCSSALRRARGKTGSARPSGAAGTRPQPSLVTVLVSLEGRGVPGDVWQVLVPVLWGFIGLAELEPHPERCIPSIPKNPMAPYALGKEDANPTPSWHPRPPHQSFSISAQGYTGGTSPQGSSSQQSQGARHQMGRQLWVPSSNSPLFQPVIAIATDARGMVLLSIPLPTGIPGMKPFLGVN